MVRWSCERRWLAARLFCVAGALSLPCIIICLPCRREYNFRGIPLAVVKHLTRQTLSALDYLHRTCNIIHTGALLDLCHADLAHACCAPSSARTLPSK